MLNARTQVEANDVLEGAGGCKGPADLCELHIGVSMNVSIVMYLIEVLQRTQGYSRRHRVRL